MSTVPSGSPGRTSHTLTKPFFEETMDTNTYLTCHTLLAALVRYLTDNYEDDLWDSDTRELLEEANDHLGWPKIEWNIDDDTGCSTEELNDR